MVLNIDEFFLRDPRIDHLAIITGEIKQTARGRLLDLFMDSILKLQPNRTEEEIDLLCAWFNPERGSYALALERSKLAERQEDGTFRIKGVTERMEWLQQIRDRRKEAGRKGGLARVANLKKEDRKDSGRFQSVDHLPGDDQASASKNQALAKQNQAKPGGFGFGFGFGSEKQEEIGVAAEKPAARPAPTFEAIPEFTHETVRAVIRARGVNQKVQKAWLDAYGDIGWITQEILGLVAWAEANPSRAPRSQWSSFFTRNMARAWERHRRTLGGSAPAPSPIKRDF